MDEDLLKLYTDKVEHRQTRRQNRLRKFRDRIHGKLRNVPFWIWRKRIEPDYTFNRQKTHTETGYGVAYESRSKSDLFK